MIVPRPFPIDFLPLGTEDEDGFLADRIPGNGDLAVMHHNEWAGWEYEVEVAFSAHVEFLYNELDGNGDPTETVNVTDHGSLSTSRTVTATVSGTMPANGLVRTMGCDLSFNVVGGDGEESLGASYDHTADFLYTYPLTIDLTFGNLTLEEQIVYETTRSTFRKPVAFTFGGHMEINDPPFGIRDIDFTLGFVGPSHPVGALTLENSKGQLSRTLYASDQVSPWEVHVVGDQRDPRFRITVQVSAAITVTTELPPP